MVVYKSEQNVVFTHCLLVLSADNICKQLGSNMSGLILIQTVSHSDC